MKIEKLLMCFILFGTVIAGVSCKQKQGPLQEDAVATVAEQEPALQMDAELGEELSASPQAGAMRAADGGILVVAATSAPLTLDPVKYTSSAEADIINQIGETLVIYNEDNRKLMPGIVKEWQVSEDGRAYDFVLRDDVYFQAGRFQEGRPIVGDDVKYSLERVYNECLTDRICRDYFDYVEVVSDKRITIHLKEPCQYFLDALTDVGNIIIPREEVEGWGDEFGFHLIGSGPYKLDTVILEEATYLIRNEDYWRKYPHLDGVEIRVVADTSQCLPALIADEIQILPVQQVEAIQTIQSSRLLHQFDSLSVPYIRFNMVNGPTADSRVREALLMAIDIDGLVSGIYRYGDGIRAYQPVSPLSWAFSHELNQLVPKYNPEGARALLSEAGYGDGLELDFYISSTIRREMMAQLVQHYLGEVGVTLNIHIERTTDLSLLLAGAWESDVVNLYGGTWTTTINPHSTLTRLFSTSYLDNVSNSGGYQNPQVDEWLRLAAHESNEEVLSGLYGNVVTAVLQDYTGLYYGYDRRSWGVSPSVRDLTMRADGRLLLCTPFNNVWLETP